MTGAEAPALGAFVEATGVRFAVWSDRAQVVAVVLYDARGDVAGEVRLQRHPADPALFVGFAQGLSAGARYNLALDGRIIVDPYAHWLPDGVHGPARVSSPPSKCRHPKRRIQLDSGEVFYELHVGTFTPEGTFESAASRFRDLKWLGVTVIELMPVGAFAGNRGWGYDGVGLFAPFAPYGSPAQLSELIDTAHGLGMSVVLDVVYNHLGPAGAYLHELSDHYFDRERKNPWGHPPALKKAPFRRFVLQNARHWLLDFGFDGLRLDAVHELEPGGDPHILDELSVLAQSLEPPAALLAEDDRNDPQGLLRFGIDGVWSDDFHHCLHALLTGEQDGYYRAYAGTLGELAGLLEAGQLYEGQVSPTTGKERGKPAHGVSRARLLYALQNHDQIGNRAHGDRVDVVAGLASYRAASLLLLFLPSTPLLFMGQEWASSSPFLFFSDHSGALGEAVSRGRREEFGHFEAFRQHEAEPVPDPQELAAFGRSKLDWAERDLPEHAQILALYRRALELRRTDEVLRFQTTLSAGVSGALLWVKRQSEHGERWLVWNTAEGPVRMAELELPLSHSYLLLESGPSSRGWAGELAPRTAYWLAPSPATNP